MQIRTYSSRTCHHTPSTERQPHWHLSAVMLTSWPTSLPAVLATYLVSAAAIFWRHTIIFPSLSPYSAGKITRTVSWKNEQFTACEIANDVYVFFINFGKW